MTKAVFFDFGGTLVSPLRDGYPVFEDVMRSRGVRLDRPSYERAEAAVGGSLGSFLYEYLGKSPGFWDTYHARVLEYLGVVEETNELVQVLHDAFTSPRWHRPYPETTEVLDTIARRGVPMHVVSNNTELLPETLARLGWSGHFATVTFSQEAGVEKPDPRVFRLALDRAGRSPEEVVHVGDSWEADVVGARSAGIPAVWVDREGRDPGREVRRVTDLRGVLSYLEDDGPRESGR